jgi:hypothetical protein
VGCCSGRQQAQVSVTLDDSEGLDASQQYPPCVPQVLLLLSSSGYNPLCFIFVALADPGALRPRLLAETSTRWCTSTSQKPAPSTRRR